MDKRFSHNMTHSRFYSIWANIIIRCGYKTHSEFNHYGGKKIKNEWSNFEDFKRDMYESYLYHCEQFGEKDTTIDRIETLGNYCKENCKWATMKEQQRNRTNNHLITFKGQTKCVAEWAELVGLKYTTLIRRLYRGWSINRALTYGL